MKDGELAELDEERWAGLPSYTVVDPYYKPPPRGEDLPYDDGEPLESEWHRDAMNLLIDSVKSNWRDRRDFYVGGNMFVYYSLNQKMNIDFRRPDFFVVLGADRDPPRKSWVMWEEGGRSPNLVIELVSESTADIDYGIKKEIYQTNWKTAEYYCFDPKGPTIRGWRLTTTGYEPIEAEGDRYWSNTLKMFLGPWKGRYADTAGVWPRFFDRRGRLVKTFSETAEGIAEAAVSRAEAEQRRAEAAEAEVAALKKKLAAAKRKKS
jgi:Uma2 family endonuclease